MPWSMATVQIKHKFPDSISEERMSNNNKVIIIPKKLDKAWV